METRIDLMANELGAKIAKRFYGVSLLIEQSPLPKATQNLVTLRVSQINGCSACVDAGAASAAKAGVSPEKLLALAAWYENPLFDDAERAALALTEAATRLSDRPGAVTDEIWAEAAKHYDEQQLGALTLMVAITNFFNRINTTLRTPPGTQFN